MRVLLLNPYIYDFTAFDLWLRPLGLHYIAAVLQKYTAAEIFWIDLLDRGQSDMKGKPKADGRGKYQRVIVSKPPLYEKIPRQYSRYGLPLATYREKLCQLPDVDFILVTSLMTYWHEGVKVALEMARSRFPRAQAVLGGILPTLLGEQMGKSGLADHYVAGYGEAALLALLEKHGCPMKQDINPVALKDPPLPAHEFATNKNVLPLLTSRGCPYHCAYCASSLLNPKFVERSVDSVVEEIRHFVSLYGTQHFILFDDALLAGQGNRFREIFSMLDLLPDISFHTPNGLQVSDIDQGVAELLFRCRFKTIRLSLESVAKKILEESSNKVSIDMMEKAVQNLVSSGFRRDEIEVYLFFGYPGQTIKEFEDTLAFVDDLQVVPRLSIFSPVPGTPSFLKLQKSGLLADPVDPFETNKIYFLFAKSGFSAEEIAFLKQKTITIARKNLREKNL